MLGTNQLTNIGKYRKSAEMSLTTLNSWKVLCSLQTKHSFCVCVLVVPWSSHWFCIVKPHPGLISKVLSQKSVTLQYGFYILRNNSRWHMNKLKFFHPNASFREKKALKKVFSMKPVAYGCKWILLWKGWWEVTRDWDLFFWSDPSETKKGALFEDIHFTILQKSKSHRA